MDLPRVDELTEPVRRGRYYLVPTILYTWYDDRREWPVIGPRHADAEIIGFRYPHYHIDGRFLSASLWARIGDWNWNGNHHAVSNGVLHKAGAPDHPAAIYRPLRCSRTRVIYPDTAARAFWLPRLENAYADKIAVTRDCRLVCPHKGAPLDSLVPNTDGVITCPLHGLRWHRDTGTPAWVQS